MIIMAFVASLGLSCFFYTLLILVIVFDEFFFFLFRVSGNFFVSLKTISEMFKRVTGIMGFFAETCGCPVQRLILDKFKIYLFSHFFL